jgi:thermitase
MHDTPVFNLGGEAMRKSCIASVLVIVAGLPAAAWARQPNFVPNRVLVKFHQGAPAALQAQAVRATGGQIEDAIAGIGVKILRVPGNEAAAAAALKNRPEVEFAEVDHLWPLNSQPNDPQYSNQWHLPKIATTQAWQTATGADVIVAILDTGVDLTHPDLAANLVPGWNFWDNNSNASDVHGHGTAVAGVVGAVTNNSIGVASIAPGCRIMPIRISDPQGYGSTSAMANGLVWSSDRGARVANISYMVSTSITVRNAAQYFQNAGGVVTVASGNYSTVTSNADNPYVLTVSATTSSDSIASYSNTGTDIDISAPGSGIRTTNRGGGYGSWSGTSFSAPTAAGVAALVISANPSLSGAQVQQAMFQGATDLGLSGWDTTFGWGRVDAAQSVEAAIAMSGSGSSGGSSGGSTGGGNTGPLPDTTPPVVSITSPTQGASVNNMVTVGVSAYDDVGVTRVELRVNGQLVSTSTSAPFNNLKWNAKKAAPGGHSLQTVAYDAANNMGVSQVVQVVR